MWTDHIVGVLACLAVISTATATYPGFTDFAYTSSVYPYSPFGYQAPQILPAYDYYTGPSTSYFGNVPNYFYPGFVNPAVQLDSQKPSNEVDSNVDDKKVETKTKPNKDNNDLCKTFQDAVGKDGLHNFYSIGNGPLYIKNGFEFTGLPPFYPWPQNPFGPAFVPPVPEAKPGAASDESKTTDDDSVAVERKVSVKDPKAAEDPERKVSISVPSGQNDESSKTSENAPSATNEDGANTDEDETKTIAPLLPSSEPPSTSGDDSTQADDSMPTSEDNSNKKKRQS